MSLRRALNVRNQTFHTLSAQRIPASSNTEAYWGFANSTSARTRPTELSPSYHSATIKTLPQAVPKLHAPQTLSHPPQNSRVPGQTTLLHGEESRDLAYCGHIPDKKHPAVPYHLIGRPCRFLQGGSPDYVTLNEKTAKAPLPIPEEEGA